MFISSNRSLLCSSVHILSLQPSIASSLFLRLIICQLFLLPFQMLYLITAGTISACCIHHTYISVPSSSSFPGHSFLEPVCCVALKISTHIWILLLQETLQRIQPPVSRGRWQHYKSGSRTFCGAVMQKKSAKLLRRTLRQATSYVSFKKNLFT